MASDQALEPINVATSGIERVHFQRFCIRLLGRAAAFISYALPDAVVANSIVENLERQGLRCWLAPREKRPHACGRFTVQSTARTL